MMKRLKLKQNSFCIGAIALLLGFWTNVEAQSTQPHKILYVSNIGSAANTSLQMGSIVKYPLSITSNTTLYLQNKDKKIVVVKGEKKFSSKELEVLFSTDKGISQGYFEYVIKKMTAHAEEGQHSFGGVSRSHRDFAPVQPLPGEVLSIDSIRFTWNSKPNTSNYFFNLVDTDGNVFLKIQVKDTTLVLFPEYQSMLTDADYGWFISERAFGSDVVNPFSICSKEALKQFKIQQSVLLLQANTANGLCELIGFYIKSKRYSQMMPHLTRLEAYEEYVGLAAEIRNWVIGLMEGTSE